MDIDDILCARQDVHTCADLRVTNGGIGVTSRDVAELSAQGDELTGVHLPTLGHLYLPRSIEQ